MALRRGGRLETLDAGVRELVPRGLKPAEAVAFVAVCEREWDSEPSIQTALGAIEAARLLV